MHLRLSFIFSVCDSVASIVYSNRNLRKKWKEESTDRKKIVLPNGSEKLHSKQQPRAAAVVIRSSCASTPQEETVLPRLERRIDICSALSPRR